MNNLHKVLCINEEGEIVPRLRLPWETKQENTLGNRLLLWSYVEIQLGGRPPDAGEWQDWMSQALYFKAEDDDIALGF